MNCTLARAAQGSTPCAGARGGPGYAYVAALVIATTVAPVARQPAQPSLKFEAASVKPVPGDAAKRVSVTQYEGNRFTATNATLLNLLRSAYGSSKYVVPGQIVGGPEWLETERFDVSAVAAGTPAREDFEMMQRALLADRFRLAVREATREQPVLALVVARDDRRLGPKIIPVSVACVAARFAPAKPAPAAPIQDGLRPPTNVGCDTAMVSTGLTVRFSARAITLDALAQHVTTGLRHTTLDRTGLPGRYDLDLEYLNPTIERGVQPPTLNGQPVDTPPLLEALREQLGFKVERDRGQVPVLIIEHVERPQPD
jgi:uncharacterized protein (TIGR03435 family)